MNSKELGLTLAVLGSVWIVAWPWMGIGGPTAPLVAVVCGVAAIWEGFARFAQGLGLSRAHGLCSLTIFLVYYAIFFWWLGVVGANDGGEVTLRVPYLVMNALLPIALTWTVYFVSIGQGRKAKERATGP